ncbi:MAG TPA: YkgJ family cysteine cluster protein, partial [Euryarchaeota archaeon]|nr:YkgJ family cysteine cluster protein [Euryarchaeota archaeon]
GDEEPLPPKAKSMNLLDVTVKTRWSCIFCGECCTDAFADSWLLNDVAKTVGKPLDGLCSRLGRDNRCSDYSNRPSSCRAYPFVMVKHQGKVYLGVHAICPGLNTGAEIELEKIKARLKHLYFSRDAL